MKFRQLVLVCFIFMFLTACQNTGDKTRQQPQVVILTRLDLYPQYSGCPDYFEKEKQLNCLMSKMSKFLAYNLNKNYQKEFENIQDTLWLKFQIDTLGLTKFVNLIHFKDSLNDSIYKKIFHKIALQIPKIKPAVYRDQPVNFEFKIPVMKKKLDSFN